MSESEVQQKLRDLVAGLVGISPEDIDEEDLLTEDLHMSVRDIADLKEKLIDGDFIDKIEISPSETFGSLTEKIESEAEIE